MVAKTLFILFLLHMCGQHNALKRRYQNIEERMRTVL